MTTNPTPTPEQAQKVARQRFESKVAWVSGAAAGIGRAAAVALAREGASVMVVDIDEQGLAETVAEIEAAGGTATAMRCDVSDAADIAAAVDETVARYGRLDVAFNNAGIEQPVAPVHDIDLHDWDRLHAVNVRSVFLCMKHQIPQMLGQGSGSIVNTSSGAGVMGIAGQAAYAATKYAVIGLTKSAALDYADAGIRINAVCPGIIETPMMNRFSGGTPEGRARVVAQEPIGRMGRPEEIADAVLWLSSEDASFVVGHALLIDGGQTV